MNNKLIWAIIAIVILAAVLYFSKDKPATYQQENQVMQSYDEEDQDLGTIDGQTFESISDEPTDDSDITY